MREIRPIQKYLRATVQVPGSKSITQRALIAASLAEGESRLENILLSDDTRYLTEGLRALGATILADGGNAIVIGTNGEIRNPGREIFLGNNGTALRFLVSLVSLGSGSFVLTGDKRLCERPIKPLLEALHSLGVTTSSRDETGYPPVTTCASGIEGGRVTLADVESSQYISSLLMSSPYARRDCSIHLSGRTVSRPYIDMTRQVMEEFGVHVECEGKDAFTVKAGQRYVRRRYTIEGDASSATYFFLAAALCGGEVRVRGINPENRRGDIRFLDILEDLGCRIARSEQYIEVKGGALTGGDWSVDMGDMPDCVPTVAVLAAFRPGRTVITNVHHLRFKESNRLAALVAELNRIGAVAEETADGLAVIGKRLHGAEIETYNDHRIAMSFAVAGLVVPGIAITNPSCVDKSFPGFWHELAQLHEE